MEDMVTICGSTLINIGTLSKRWIEAMIKAAKKAHELGKCWVLDPVGAGATPLRMETCKELLKYRPTVIRGNASEILALAGTVSSGRGVDSTDSSLTALNAGKALACFAVASEMAREKAKGPGSLRVGKGMRGER